MYVFVFMCCLKCCKRQKQNELKWKSCELKLRNVLFAKLNFEGKKREKTQTNKIEEPVSIGLVVGVYVFYEHRFSMLWNILGKFLVSTTKETNKIFCPIERILSREKKHNE